MKKLQTILVLFILMNGMQLVFMYNAMSNINAKLKDIESISRSMNADVSKHSEIVKSTSDTLISKMEITNTRTKSAIEKLLKGTPVYGQSKRKL